MLAPQGQAGGLRRTAGHKDHASVEARPVAGPTTVQLRLSELPLFETADAKRLPLLEQLAAQPALRDNAAAGLPLQVRLAQTCLRLERPEAALAHAQRAAHWLQAVWPLEMSPAEVQLTLARCARASDQPALARQAVQTGLDWVQRVAARQIDAVYRESWAQRNPVNRDLLALAPLLTSEAAPSSGPWASNP